MTQILLYRCEEGIALATDSRAVLFPTGEESPRDMEVQKLFALDRHVLVITGGAGFGVLLCREFQRHVHQAGLQDFQEIADLAIGFFRSRTEAYRREASTALRPDLDRVYFLLAGAVPGDTQQPFQSLLLASESPEDPVHQVETSHVLAIPRQMGLEYRLTHLPASQAILDHVESLFETLLLKLAASGDEVGPPFHFIRITTDGIRARTR